MENDKDGGNGKLGTEKQPEKTQEQLDQERAERFAKDPHSFIEIGKLICAVMRNPKSTIGVSVLVNVCGRAELDIAQIEITHRMDLCRRSMDIESGMKRHAMKGLIVPGKPHRIMDFMRRKK